MGSAVGTCVATQIGASANNGQGNGLDKNSRTRSIETLFAYDEHRLLGEYDTQGNALQETVWLGNLPVATVINGVVYHIHTDHLGTPRVITDSSNKEVWRWDSDPFGMAATNEDPDGDGVLFSYNLRFPGQYFDVETGGHYNYSRDYDPNTGRYLESDPIGLIGGLNTYLYVESSPLANTDVLGLADSMSTRIIALAARGDIRSLNNLIDSGVLNPVQRQLAKQAVSKLNKINHIFGNAEHKLDAFVNSCRNKEDALSTLNDAFSQAVKGLNDGLIEITIDVNGFPITVRGNVVNGIPKLGTAFIK